MIVLISRKIQGKVRSKEDRLVVLYVIVKNSYQMNAGCTYMAMYTRPKLDANTRCSGCRNNEI